MGKVREAPEPAYIYMMSEIDLSTIRRTDRLKGLVVALVVRHFRGYFEKEGGACLEMREKMVKDNFLLAFLT